MKPSSCRSKGCCLWAVLLLAGPANAQPAEPSPGDLLAAYEQSVRPYDFVHYRAETTLRYSGPALPPDTPVRSASFEVWRDGDRLRYTAANTLRVPNKGQVITQRHLSEWVYPRKGSLLAILDPSKKNVSAVVAQLDPVPPNQRSLSAFSFALVHGHLDDNGVLPLAQVLRESPLSARKDRLRGREVWVLEGNGNWGHHALWLDPAAGLRPLRVIQRKSEDSWFVPDKPLRMKTGRPPWYPKLPRRGASRTVEVTWAGGSVGPAAIAALAFHSEEHFSNGQTVKFREEVRFPRTEFAPDFTSRDPFRLGTPVPNGTPVQVDDRPGINYEWQDGQVVKCINQESLANLEGLRFLTGRGWGRSLALFAGLGLTAASVWWYVRCRSRARGA